MRAICPASAGWDLLGGETNTPQVLELVSLRLLSVLLFHPALDHVVLSSAALRQREPSPGTENPGTVQSLSIPST